MATEAMRLEKHQIVGGKRPQLAIVAVIAIGGYFAIEGAAIGFQAAKRWAIAKKHELIMLEVNRELGGELFPTRFEEAPNKEVNQMSVEQLKKALLIQTSRMDGCEQTLEEIAKVATR